MPCSRAWQLGCSPSLGPWACSLFLRPLTKGSKDSLARQVRAQAGCKPQAPSQGWGTQIAALYPAHPELHPALGSCPQPCSGPGTGLTAEAAQPGRPCCAPWAQSRASPCSLGGAAEVRLCWVKGCRAVCATSPCAAVPTHPDTAQLTGLSPCPEATTSPAAGREHSILCPRTRSVSRNRM